MKIIILLTAGKKKLSDISKLNLIIINLCSVDTKQRGYKNLSLIQNKFRESIFYFNMPKIKQIQQLKHPNSRKTKTLAKQIHKLKNREKSKFSTNVKLNLQGEKCAWFRDNLDPECTHCNVNILSNLIQKYLSRFDEELKQIQLKHSIGNRKNRQHANREDVIKMTVKREFDDFNSCGIELPNILDPIQLDKLKNWNGELRFLQNFKFKRFSKKNLEDKKQQIINRNCRMEDEVIN